MQGQRADQRAEKQGRRLPMSERAARTARDEMIIMGRFPNVHVVTFYLLFPGQGEIARDFPHWRKKSAPNV